MAEINIKISADSKQAIVALQQVSAVASKTGESVHKVGESIKKAGANSGAGFSSGSGGILGAFSKVSSGATAVISTLGMIKDAAGAAFGPGFNYYKDMEMHKLGIAGILQSMTLLNGEAVSFSDAMAVSSDMMGKLQADAVKTAASSDDLVTTFQAMLAPGIKAGMQPDQIRQLSVAGVNAMKTIMPGDEVSQKQMIQELQGLVQGGIQPSSTLAAALGITNEDIEQAKTSSEGLFGFLMDRLQRFGDTTRQFPETIAGKLNQLDEVWTQASAAFTKEFEEPIKSFLSEITSLIGTVNEETGKVEINPAILGVIDELKAGFEELKKLASDLAPSFSWVEESALPALKDLWQIIKDVVAIFMDWVLITENITAPLKNFLWKVIRELIFAVAELTGYLKEAFNYWAKIFGGKKDNQLSGSGVSQFRQSEDSNTKPPVKTGVYTSRSTENANRNNGKLVQASQGALRFASAAVEARAKADIDRIQRDRQEFQNSQEQKLSPEDFGQKMAQFQYDEQNILVEKARALYRAIAMAVFETDAAKTQALADAQQNINKEMEKLNDCAKDLSEVTGIIAGNLQELPMQAGMEDKKLGKTDESTKNFAYVVGNYLKQNYGLSPEITSGWRSPENNAANNGSPMSWHLQGKAVDLNLGDISEELAAEIKAYAEQFFNEVLYHDAGSGKHLHLGDPKENAASFKSQFSVKMGAVYGKFATQVYNNRMALAQEADEIAASLAEAKGDFSNQKADIIYKHGKEIQKFEQAKMPEVAAMLRQRQAIELRNIDFAQLQRDVAETNGVLANEQRILLNQLAGGTKAAPEVVSEFLQVSSGLMEEPVKKLREMIAGYMKIGDVTSANKAQDILNNILNTVFDFSNKVEESLNAKLQSEISLINADPNRTQMQKEDAINAARRANAGTLATVQEEAANDIRSKDGDITKAVQLEEAAKLNRALAETPTLLQQIRQASAQALENGLLDFFRKGILECKNLGEAFRNLAISVLQSIQNIYAQEMTRRVMGMLTGTPSQSQPSADPWRLSDGIRLDPNFGLGSGFTYKFGAGFANGGEITGTGTGTSDSILAWLSNGEFVIKAASVKQFGVSFFNALNNGLLPRVAIPAFAGGGIVGGSAVGPRELAASLVNNNSTSIPLKIVNVTDANEVGRYLQSRSGEKVMVNWMKNNAGTVRQVLNIRG